MTTGQRIRKLRIQNKMSQQVLASELGYKSYTTVSKWENDISLPPTKQLTELAHVFGVSIEYILDTDN